MNRSGREQSIRERTGRAPRPTRAALRILACLALCLLLAPPPSFASWSSEFALPGILGEVFCAIEHEGDLIVGGEFTIAGHTRVHNIARWDGREFHPFGEFDDEVRALALHDGKLIAAGRFHHVDGVPATVAILDEHGWSSLGGLFENRSNPIRNAVFTLFPSGGEVYAGGEFTHVDGEAAASLARWDGSEWQPVPVSLPGTRPVVWTIASFRGDLVVGGEFAGGKAGLSNLAAWNGTQWSDLGGGVPGPVHALLALEDSLVVGGRFTRFDDPDTRNVVTWNGSVWSPLGTGLFGGNNVVHTLTVHQGEIYAGGSFALAETGHANKVGRWDGEHWFDLGAGVVGDGEVHQMLSYRNMLIAVGRFAQLSGNVCYSIGQWNGFWNPLLRSQGMEDRVRAFVEYDGALIAAGRFQRAGGSATAAEIVRWDGARWNDLGAKVNDEATELAVQDGLLFAAGEFLTYAGGISRHAIVYDGNTWFDPRGGASGIIRAMSLYAGQIVIGGEFVRAGGRPATRIAQWNGQIWVGLDEGVDAAPEALLARGDTLFVGGRFQRAGNREAPYLAIWNPTRRWEPFGEPLDGPVLALHSFEGSLIAAGEFSRAGETVLGGIARWSPQGWVPLGGGFDGNVEVLAEHAGRLVAGGRFSHADGKPARGLAFWDGTSWNSLGDGVAGADSVVHALWSQDESLWVGGSFTQVGDTVSIHVARWDGDLPVLVWPGDTDDNGTVDARDLLPIGRFFGLEGPARAAGSRAWSAQRVSDWEDNAAARADTDGNGQVDAEDVRALVENWERSRFEDSPGAASLQWAATQLLSALPKEGAGSALASLRRVLESYLAPRAIRAIEAPNPFLPGSSIRLNLLALEDARTGGVTLELFDVHGRRVHRFPVEPGSGQESTLRWDGHLESGRLAPAGIYLLRLRSNGRDLETRRIVLMR